MSDLADYKQAMIDLMLDAGVLTFGDFVTKSGRRTPYFCNLGNICDGAGIGRLGEFYARAIMAELGADFDNLFGPAYKGIPLAAVAAAELMRLYGKNVSFSYNRKEAKDHGEGGSLVGHKYVDGDRVLIIEDVTTAGTSIYQSVPLLEAAAAVELAGVVVAVDRRERGKTAKSALQEIADTYAIPTFAIVTIDDIVAYLHGREVRGRVWIDDEMHRRIAAYRAEFGAA